MNLRDTVTPSVLQAATGLLQPYCPDLSPKALVRALRAYQSDPAPAATTATTAAPKKPMTRKAVAELLGCSLQTVNRYMNDGKLRRIVLSARSVRIDPASMESLLAGNASSTVEKEG